MDDWQRVWSLRWSAPAYCNVGSLANPRLLILDEATSALDYITERSMLNLKKPLGGVFHYTSTTTRSSDQI